MNDLPFLTEDHERFRDTLRRFIQTEVVPHAESWEDAGKVPREVLRQLGELGYLGIRYPATYGGAELDTVYSAILAEELGRSTFGGFAVTVLVHTDMASPHLGNFGNAEQLARWMPGIIAGKTICAVAVTEPDAGSDVAGIKARAVRDGDHYVLTGTKMFITNGVHGDLYFVGVKTDTSVKGSRGISIFAVEKGTPGFSVGRSLKKTGWLCSDTAELVFDQCRVPAANLIGGEHKGFYSIMRNFQNERIVLGAQAMGEAQQALDLTVDYVRNRKAFGGVLWDKQAIRQRLAMLSAKVAAGRQLAYHSARLDAQGHECVKEVSMVKAYCGELVNEVMYTCQQFHGGMSYVRETAIERMARDARIQAIGGGATEVMLEEVAKRL
ncbi:acyl-CoA dehydrogenase family protein [Algiphilus sp. W345]|uniref:Acyl-CoA dehydrogenase family protein n=1 Tax=Banduia mediterranea TaxID=3075609 RepID=A0ABU2WEA5_9GAMM|nr:acyl-CoA dehydrogenase family protein [Algiphilus sp. W345]MDT0496196.1 acyl-CoA dehydrogenase family protein [Algiphilus sp. W345]